MSERTYAIRYDVHNGEFKKAEVEAQGLGGCDQILICSILKAPEKWVSYLWISSDGRGQEMHAKDKFKAWAMLARQLVDDSSLDPMSKEICRKSFEEVKQLIKGSVENG